jgi:hypothetical protein
MLEQLEPTGLPRLQKAVDYHHFLNTYTHSQTAKEAK